MRKASELVDLSVPAKIEALGVKYPKQKPGAAEVLGGVKKAANTYDSDISRISLDPRSTPHGKREDAKIAAASCREGLQPAFKAADVLESRADKSDAARLARVRPQPPTDAAARMAYETRIAEIRRSVGLLDPPARRAAYLVACATADAQVRDAFEDNPPPVFRSSSSGVPVPEPLVPANVIEEQQRARADAADPDGASEARMFRDLAATYRSTAQSVAQVLDEHWPVTPEIRKAG